MIYLASPYKHADAAVEASRYHGALEAASLLFSCGHEVFSPIAHSHNIHLVSPRTHDAWLKTDRLVIESNLITSVCILTMPGWQRSSGIAFEHVIATLVGKAVTQISRDAEDCLRIIRPIPAEIWADLETTTRVNAATWLRHKLLTDREYTMFLDLMAQLSPA